MPVYFILLWVHRNASLNHAADSFISTNGHMTWIESRTRGTHWIFFFIVCKQFITHPSSHSFFTDGSQHLDALRVILVFKYVYFFTYVKIQAMFFVWNPTAEAVNCGCMGNLGSLILSGTMLVSHIFSSFRDFQTPFLFLPSPFLSFFFSFHFFFSVPYFCLAYHL